MAGSIPDDSSEGAEAGTMTASTPPCRACSCCSGPVCLSVELPFDTSVARVARDEVVSLLGDGEDVTDAVALVCTELVTNAFLHGSPPIQLVVQLDLEEGDPAVELTVTDGGSAHRTDPSSRRELPDESGRGHLIIDALTVGSSLDVGRAGTRAWRRLPVAAPAVLSALPAPRSSKESRHGS
ncbi:ATP-binding protein [Streptomyces sp. NPDC006186]|uniref:ATP-binding protein n=1 Tax=Streptomyces sp. NPDC006186 TaxID=3155248 RepID=UPI0033AE70AF